MALVDPIVWIDCEMTGLDPEKDALLEVACIVTSGDLNTTVIEGPSFILQAPAAALAGMSDKVRAMHSNSGLIDEVYQATLSAESAELKILEFLEAVGVGPQVAPLAGNSVHVDRRFLARYMPKLDAYLHYRIIDVSTVKELCRRWYPNVFSRAPAKQGAHRALDDIRESISELVFYRENVFRFPNDTA
ncbi:probable oligoribonuclease, mitochondrial precursor [Cyanidioschyzon merolae strain 10D]|uniref:Probable oligoribonuclease, mitochondrial n=1 Tax=Cyanidioschyzon merolae (strain NIES-3377 / 10D) TaxID=280699 RepID=M1V7Q2_CYAM1|nr:probable oligoribonuclease, mitochondrial precursor [Cyanidioschyzon merolae strain 10D]BAM83280.1 probable oligoribonuclease, mitochondrial precursor [Cyanidioschyzon merolae strain 10D]|eukprot:XP_005539316.1 probable oligoribonuclease, mitochondrial precursor [Cyanidioschyzon merolae strain 10D]